MIDHMKACFLLFEFRNSNNLEVLGLNFIRIGDARSYTMDEDSLLCLLNSSGPHVWEPKILIFSVMKFICEKLSIL